jgi:hypothetical protein
MEIELENDLLQKCLLQIEVHLNWGSSETWTNQDFETLSEKIQLETGTLLSVTTLKRIWGKVKYESNPTITTLNALAQFIHFESWRVFTQHQLAPDRNSKTIFDQSHKQVSEGKKDSRKKWKWSLAIVTTIFCGSVIFYLFSFENQKQAGSLVGGNLDTAAFQFTSKKIVSVGVPNSVVFNYDASAAGSSDSIFIQQSWDKNLTQSVSRQEHSHSSIYYYPGFFLARLIVNHQIVKYHPLFIQTNGWLPLVEQNPIPVYFNETDARQNGFIGLSMATLKASNITLQPQTPWIDYYNVRNFGDLQTDNFIFETQVRNDFLGGSGACGNTEIKILAEGSAIVIPLSVKGCISDLRLYLLDHEINGKNQDLSAFGCDLSQWVNVRVEVVNNFLGIYVNGVKANETSLTAPATKITGLVFRFQGTGSVKSVVLDKVDGERVYEDHFEKSAAQ